MRASFPLLVVLGFCAAIGCEDEVCGPSEGSAQSITTAIGDASITYGEWRSSPNNDCGEPGGPVSLTLDAQQEGASFALTLCLPRPDKLSASPVDIADSTRVQIIDVFADVGADCIASFDRTRPADGTIAFPGICGDGDGPEGYSLQLDARIPMSIACEGLDPEIVSMDLSGLIAVEAVQF